MLKIILAASLSLLLIMPCVAGDDADVRAAITDFYGALARNDFSTVDDYLLPEGFTEYSSRGGLKIDITVPLLKKLVESGLVVNVALQHMETFVEGDMAYATFYRIGSIERPDVKNADPHTARVTSIWVRKNGRWYIKHVHNSKTGI